MTNGVKKLGGDRSRNFEQIVACICQAIRRDECPLLSARKQGFKLIDNPEKIRKAVKHEMAKRI